MRTTLRKTAAILAAMLALPATALAGGAEFGLNIDINPGFFLPDVPAATYGAAAAQPGRWNSIWSGSAGPLSLIDLNGAASGVTMTRTIGNGLGQSQCVGGFVEINWSDLMCDYAWDVTGVTNPIEYEFENLPPGLYQLYIYACQPGDTFQPGFSVRSWVDDAVVATSFISGTVLTQQFTLNKTHAIHTISVPPGGAVRVRAYDTSGEFGDEVSLNGLQFKRIGDPSAVISEPTPLSCGCNPISIVGSASGIGFSGYWVEYSQTGNDPWTLIEQSNVGVLNAELASWDTTGLPEGYYNIRLTVANVSGQTSTAFTTVYVNNTFNTIDVDSPNPAGIYGGTVCFDGTVWDNCFSRYLVEYGPTNAGPWTPVDPAFPYYTTPAINEHFATWETASGPNAVPDGTHWVRVRGVPLCGDIVEYIDLVHIDNTPPDAKISSPESCTTHCGLVEVFGTAFDENIAGWALQYTGGNQNGWVTIASGNSNIEDGLLGVWNTDGLPACCYTLRLIVSDKAQVNCTGLPHQSEFLVSVAVGIEGDLDGDGIVDLDDLQLMLFNFGMTCPPAP